MYLVMDLIIYTVSADVQVFFLFPHECLQWQNGLYRKKYACDDKPFVRKGLSLVLAYCRYTIK